MKCPFARFFASSVPSKTGQLILIIIIQQEKGRMFGIGRDFFEEEDSIWASQLKQIRPTGDRIDSSDSKLSKEKLQFQKASEDLFKDWPIDQDNLFEVISIQRDSDLFNIQMQKDELKQKQTEAEAKSPKNLFISEESHHEEDFHPISVPATLLGKGNIPEAGLILKEERSLRKMKKNTNVPKFLGRVYMKLFSEFTDPQYLEIVSKYHEEVLPLLKNKKNNSFRIADVQEMLGLDRPIVGFQNRKTMSKILRSTTKEEILKNKYIGDHKMSYMLASKVYALRCQSKTLCTRVQMQ